MENFEELLYKYYEYCYLESMHWMYENNKTDPDTVILGMSYGIDGIICKYLKETSVNLAMHSQDLFYDGLHIMKLLQSGRECSIKNCIFTIGYISLFHDISKTSWNYKCVATYWPLFRNTRHLYVSDELKTKTEECRDADFTNYYHSLFLNQPSYYNSYFSYDQTRNFALISKGGWGNMNAAEKEQYAYEIAKKHSKHLTHTVTLKENMEFFCKIFKILILEGIKVYVVWMPFSEYYRKHIDEQLKEITDQFFGQLSSGVGYLNFNDISDWSDEDFLDAEHLNEYGAKKLTLMLNNYIY